VPKGAGQGCCSSAGAGSRLPLVLVPQLFFSLSWASSSSSASDLPPKSETEQVATLKNSLFSFIYNSLKGSFIPLLDASTYMRGGGGGRGGWGETTTPTHDHRKPVCAVPGTRLQLGRVLRRGVQNRWVLGDRAFPLGPAPGVLEHCRGPVRSAGVPLGALGTYRDVWQLGVCDV
jgi:hypothetical protein